MKQYEKGFSKELFERCASMMMSCSDIAYVMRISPATLDKRCSEEYGVGAKEASAMFASNGRMRILEAQFRHADNPVMAIWLGKQYLGQKDRQESEVSESITIVNDVKPEQ